MMNPRQSPSRQTGAVLMAAMMFLIVLTFLGLAAVRATTQQTRMAAGIQFHGMTFQAAEAAIRVLLNEIATAPPNTLSPILTGAAQCTAQTRNVFARYLADAEAANVVSSTLTSNASMGFRGSCSAMGACGTATASGTARGSLSSGDSLESSFANCCFDIQSTAQHAGSGASSVQEQRVFIKCPKQE